MSRYFGIRFHEILHTDGHALLTMNEDGVFVPGYVEKQDFPEAQRFYLAKDSLPLFDVRIGDMILDEDNMNGILISISIQLDACADSPIIMRKGVHFIMPEVEEQNE